MIDEHPAQRRKVRVHLFQYLVHIALGIRGIALEALDEPSHDDELLARDDGYPNETSVAYERRQRLHITGVDADKRFCRRFSLDQRDDRPIRLQPCHVQSPTIRDAWLRRRHETGVCQELKMTRQLFGLRF